MVEWNREKEIEIQWPDSVGADEPPELRFFGVVALLAVACQSCHIPVFYVFLSEYFGNSENDTNCKLYE